MSDTFLSRRVLKKKLAYVFSTWGVMPPIRKSINEAIEKSVVGDVAPVAHGSWDGTADGYADGELVYDMWNCSVCGFDADGADDKPAWKFCPNCGAKMDKEAEK